MPSSSGNVYVTSCVCTPVVKIVEKLLAPLPISSMLPEVFVGRSSPTTMPEEPSTLSPELAYTSPLFEILNLVVPEADAAKISPEFRLSRINAAFEPIPPTTESGARVFELDPTSTPVLKSEVNTITPEPFAPSVRLPFEEVWIVVFEPPPTVIEGFLSERLPDAAPIVRVSASPNALIVVAVALNTSRLEEFVSIEVVIVGDVPKTTAPLPVSSVNVAAIIEEVPE